MTDLLWFFWIYSFGGYLVERAFAAATRAERRERKCFLLLPLCPVYGLGMLAVLALPPSWRQGPWLMVSGAAAARECGMPLSTFRYRAAGFEDAQR